MLAATESCSTRPELLLRQAEVLELAGRDADAAAALREAIELWERKGRWRKYAGPRSAWRPSKPR